MHDLRVLHNAARLHVFIRLVLAHLVPGENRAERHDIRHGLRIGAAADALRLSLFAGLPPHTRRAGGE